MKKTLVVLLVLFLIISFKVHAADRPNNKFGIHLAQPHFEDLKKAQELVNSNGGEWGYVTLVVQENDRKKDKWQDIFEKMREYRLIPLIRLATQPEGPVWKRPRPEDADEWVNFLDSLNWPTKQKHIILFNEPNHASEWGGATDPQNFADVTLTFAKKFKEKSPDFAVMLAGFDASAPQASPTFYDEGAYVSEMITNKGADEWNKYLDAWSSHSYPNPAFAGSANGAGRGTVRTYQWELELLRELGVKEMPVFITETGWDGNNISREQVAARLEYAFTNVWVPDDRIKAVTPFVLNYQSAPFTGFSFSDMGNANYYPQFYAVQGLSKIAGDPEIEEKGGLTYNLPHDLVINSSYHFGIELENNGQGWWDKEAGYQIVLQEYDKENYLFSDVKDIKPGQKSQVDFFLKTNNAGGRKQVRFILEKHGKEIMKSNIWDFAIVPLPSLDFSVNLRPRFHTEGDNFEIQFFDKNEQIVYKKSGMSVKEEKGFLQEVQNVALGEKYRVVMLKPYYLPRQIYVKFQKGKNEIKFDGMIPIDFNTDGKFDLWDVWELMSKPELVKLLLP